LVRSVASRADRSMASSRAR